MIIIILQQRNFIFEMAVCKIARKACRDKKRKYKLRILQGDTGMIDPNVMHETLKDAYIPVGRSTADMLDEVLQNTDMF